MAVAAGLAMFLAMTTWFSLAVVSPSFADDGQAAFF
jgi:hypothetical protein